jgi:hypothetical protein
VTPSPAEAVHGLLVHSLKAWRVCGHVDVLPDGGLLLTAGEVKVRVVAAQDTPPFRWMIGIDDRTRGVTSVAGVLRAVRAAVDPQHRRFPLRFASAPMIVP